MLVKLAIVLIFASVTTNAVSLKKFQGNSGGISQKQTAAETVPCCPEVGVYPSGGSFIEPIPGYRVFILIVTENGNCSEATAKDSTFECCALWGDGTEEECIAYDYLRTLCNMTHQYPAFEKSYEVDATFCNVIGDNYCCDTLTKYITVTKYN